MKINLKKSVKTIRKELVGSTCQKVSVVNAIPFNTGLWSRIFYFLLIMMSNVECLCITSLKLKLPLDAHLYPILNLNSHVKVSLVMLAHQFPYHSTLGDGHLLFLIISLENDIKFTIILTSVDNGKHAIYTLMSYGKRDKL